MRIGVGYLLQETNTFSPVETRIEDFHLALGRALADRWGGTRTEIGAFLDVLAGTEHEVVPLFAGWAMTAGAMPAATFSELRKRVVRMLQDAGPLDGLLLALHGAMCAQGTDDCEGALLAAARQVAGDEVPVVVTLDLHANVTQRMARGADALLGYRTYPHIDMYETGERAARLILRILGYEVKPVVAVQKLPLIVPPENMQTTSGPMRQVFESGEAFRREHPEILEVSAFGVQAWLDIEEMGCATLVVADRNRTAASQCAQQMAETFWHLRDEFVGEWLDPEAAIREALATDGQPVVLSESSDSPTAGSPGDSPQMLRALLEFAPETPSLLWVRDPKAVTDAWRVQPGDPVRLEVGGAFNRLYEPVPIEGCVRSLSDGRFRFAGNYNKGMVGEMGRTAVVEVGRIAVVLTEEPANMIVPEVYRSQGLEPCDYKIVVVKSANSFRSEYGPFAAKILMVDTPGISSSNLRSLPYRRVTRPIHPLDAVEFASGAAKKQSTG